MLEYFLKGMSVLSGVDWSAISALLLVIVVVVLLVRINASKSSSFFFDDLFLDESKRASVSKLANLIALILSSWAFIHLTIKGTLTSDFFTAYMLTWVANRGVSKYFEVKSQNLDDKTTIKSSNESESI